MCMSKALVLAVPLALALPSGMVTVPPLPAEPDTHARSLSSTCRSLFGLTHPALGALQDHQRFNQWMLDHGKVYATEQSEASAFAAWIKNDATIGKHNSKGLSFTLAHNEYSDITPDEFFGARLGYAANTTRAAGTMPTQMHVASGGPNPSAVDWVTAGAVTSVKNQGQVSLWRDTPRLAREFARSECVFRVSPPQVRLLLVVLRGRGHRGRVSDRLRLTHEPI